MSTEARTIAGVRLQHVNDCAEDFSKETAMSRSARVIFRVRGAAGPAPLRTMTLRSGEKRVVNGSRQTVRISRRTNQHLASFQFDGA